jgi:proteasome alpha subunit
MPTPFIYASPEQVMRDKADYARKNIARGRDVVAIEYANGILFVAENPSATLHKISEIYDRIAFAGVGLYNEYENLRRAGIQHADLKGYNYSREDVTARSLANMYSQALGQIFTESMKPYEVEILVAEVGMDGKPSEIYHIEYSGTMNDEHGCVAIGGHSEELGRYLKEQYGEGTALQQAVKLAVSALSSVDGARELNPDVLEAAVLDRNLPRRKFRRLPDAEVELALRSPSV